MSKTFPKRRFLLYVGLNRTTFRRRKNVTFVLMIFFLPQRRNLSFYKRANWPLCPWFTLNTLLTIHELTSTYINDQWSSSQPETSISLMDPGTPAGLDGLLSAQRSLINLLCIFPKFLYFVFLILVDLGNVVFLTFTFWNSWNFSWRL